MAILHTQCSMSIRLWENSVAYHVNWSVQNHSLLARLLYTSWLLQEIIWTSSWLLCSSQRPVYSLQVLPLQDDHSPAFSSKFDSWLSCTWQPHQPMSLLLVSPHSKLNHPHSESPRGPAQSTTVMHNAPWTHCLTVTICCVKILDEGCVPKPELLVPTDETTTTTAQQSNIPRNYDKIHEWGIES